MEADTMDFIVTLLIGTSVLTLLWALRLLGRRPNRRLRHLVLAVTIISITQTVVFLCHWQGQSLSQAVGVLQQCITSMGTLAALYLLWVEIRDRNRTDHLLRLAEHGNHLRRGNRARDARLRGLPESGT
jgi:hypothetical protein